MCKTESSSLHETETTSSALEEEIYATNDYLKDLNALRKKLNMLEVTDTPSTDSEKSITHKPFPCAAPEQRESILESGNDLHQKNTTETLPRKILNVKKQSLLTCFKKTTNRNLQRVPLVDPSYELADMQLGKQIQSSNWSSNLQNYVTKTLYVKHDFNDKLDSSAGDTDDTKCYIPPEKKLCIRETTPHIPGEPIKGSDLFLGSKSSQQTRQDSARLDRCHQIGDQYVFNKRLSTATSQDSNESTNSKTSSNFTETSRTNNFRCAETITESVTSTSSSNCSIPSCSNRKSAGEPRFLLNLPSSICEDSSDCVVPTVKTIVLSKKSSIEHNIKTNKSENLKRNASKSGNSTITKDVTGEDSHIIQTSDYQMDQTSFSASMTHSPENSPRVRSGVYSTDSYPSLEEIFTNTDEIKIDVQELKKLKDDLYLTSNICAPLKPKAPCGFPRITKVTSLIGDLESISLTNRSSLNASEEDGESNPERTTAHVLNGLRIAAPSGEFNDYKEVAGKLMTAVDDKKKFKYVRKASGNETSTSGSTGAGEVALVRSSADILQCRRKQSTEMDFYSIPSESPSINSLQPSPGCKTDLDSANDRNRCVGCFCFGIFFPNR